MNYQKIILIGNTTDKAKVSQPENKTAYADLTVAVNRNPKEADFFPVRLLGSYAEHADKIEKGARLLVEGRLQISRFTPEGGKPRTVIRVLADLVRFVDPKPVSDRA
jgi:single-stranded DNA-binding protein